jgi:hypothetical protein
MLIWRRLQDGVVRTAAVLLLGALFVVGCSDQAPLNPDLETGRPQTDAVGTLSGAPRPGAPEAGAGSDSETEWTVERTIGVHGGTMQLDRGLRLHFPPGALTERTRVTANMTLDGERGEATRIEFEFLPSITFRRPVTLAMGPRYLGGDGDLNLWLFDPVTGTWVMAERRPGGGRGVVTFEVGSFSQYAVSR